jgi:hypothetical protein
MRIRRLGGRADPPTPLEPAADAIAAIRRAEEAAAARLAAEESEQAERAAAERRAAALLEQAAARAAERAEQRRQTVGATVKAEAQRELTAAAAEIARLQQAARDRHEVIVQHAVQLVLTGEAPCSSR